MPVFEWDGIQFNYEDEGDGPAVVFCHGLTGDLDRPKDLIGPLAGHRLVLMDCRAHGKTEPIGPTDQLNFETFANDFRALADYLGLDKFVMGGISMGAGVTARFVTQWPERLHGIVLVRPAWLDRELPENLAILPKVAEILSTHGPVRGLDKFRDLSEFSPYTEYTQDTVETIWEVCSQPEYVERRVRLERIPGSCPIDSWEEVQKIQVPALVVGSQRDATHPWEFAEEWARRLTNAELVEVPPKWEDLEAYHEAFRPHFKNFLQRIA